MNRKEQILHASKFIKYEEWEDYWCFKPITEIEFEVLRKFNDNSWKLSQKPLKIVVESEKEIVEPTPRQLDSLKFVKANQSQILRSIFNFHQSLIFPLYDDNIDIEEDQIISEESQTNKIYAIESIQIPLLHEANSNYFILNFNFLYDDHRMSFLFKNLSIIDFTTLGNDFIDFIELHEKKLVKGNKGLTVSIYNHPNRTFVFRAKHSLHDKIEFAFENKLYVIGIHRDEWPQNFRIFFYPMKPKTGISLNDILNTASKNI